MSDLGLRKNINSWKLKQRTVQFRIMVSEFVDGDHVALSECRPYLSDIDFSLHVAGSPFG